jgi:hypothetical protein
VALSDSCNQALHVRKFLEGQGYDMGPVRVYQDNISCMALVARGRSGAEKTRHIDIRYYWVKERVDKGEAPIEHKGTEKMYANLLSWGRGLDRLHKTSDGENCVWPQVVAFWME